MNTPRGTRIGIQLFEWVLDTGLRRYDAVVAFYWFFSLQLSVFCLHAQCPALLNFGPVCADAGVARKASAASRAAL